ncbi:MAG: phage tail protein [Actinomycetota bacterium]|nr:phage tail protein [Actinomycetota bacterium]HSH23632.1 phage tail protein [Acidimicrobiales bacterium]
MPINDDTQLGLANRFKVTIDKSDYDLGSWAKVEGLDVKWDLVEYRSGDGANNRWYFPGKTDYSTIKLTRAACKDTGTVKKWLTATSFEHEAHSGKIELLDSKNGKVADWTLKNVLPLKWSITGFDASASKVATETLELAHLGFLDDDVA